MNLSTKQQQAVRFLGGDSATTKQIARHCGLRSGQVMLQSLYQQGYITFVGRPGKGVGSGRWSLTDRGKNLARELGGPHGETMDGY